MLQNTNLSVIKVKDCTDFKNLCIFFAENYYSS